MDYSMEDLRFNSSIPSRLSSTIRDRRDTHETIQEPRRFKIEVIGCKKQFIFEIPPMSALSLKDWTKALFANWDVSKSFKRMNGPQILSSKFWKV